MTVHCEPYENGEGVWHIPGCSHIDWSEDGIIMRIAPVVLTKEEFLAMIQDADRWEVSVSENRRDFLLRVGLNPTVYITPCIDIREIFGDGSSRR